MTDKMTRSNMVEMTLIVLFHFVGIGSILFGALSGNRYGYYFIIVGAIVLALVIFYSIKREAQLNESAVKLVEHNS